MSILYNKKVLLRECKRHTACHVASACYAALSNGWGGTPSSPGGGGGTLGTPTPSRPGGYPRCIPNNPDLVRGYPPPSRPGMGYPHPDLRWGTPTHTWERVPPHQDLRWGTPHPDLGWGTPPPTDLGCGTPPPKCEQTENITFPILRMRAVKMPEMSDLCYLGKTRMHLNTRIQKA